MAHSSVPNAGQKYGSARKHGAAPNTLKVLKVAVTSRGKPASDDTAKEQKRVNEIIEKQNKDFKTGPRWW